MLKLVTSNRSFEEIQVKEASTYPQIIVLHWCYQTEIYLQVYYTLLFTVCICKLKQLLYILFCLSF